VGKIKEKEESKKKHTIIPTKKYCLKMSKIYLNKIIIDFLKIFILIGVLKFLSQGCTNYNSV